jgi:hypothetical protein
VEPRHLGHRRGRYTLHGQDVELWGDVQVTSWDTAPTGNLRVHGLPFESHADTPEAVGVLLPRAGLTLSADMTQVVAVLHVNSENLRFYEWGSGESGTIIDAAAVSPPVRLEFWLRYRKKEDEVIDPAP